ncbi:MAG TPA: DedA family protein [Microbacterium sp.]|uniref:DedA family protein n=1 Tax=Microbacterium sp. TaxID=51671 RepID=UPI002B48B033|nr:DedA family protein [Microbacterium sp.]HKT57233.1 DedA family protein [Microbacterium sp.]
MNEFVTWLLGVIQDVDPVLRTLLAGVAMAFETSVFLGVIVPGDTVAIAAGTAVGSPVEGLALVGAIVAGSLLGESVGFWLGKTFGPALRASRLGRRLGERNWDRAEGYLSRRGGPAIFLSRFLPVLHSLVPLTVGMSGMRYRRFIAWTLPACVLWASAYVTVAALAAGSYRQMADNLHQAGYLFVAVIVAFILLTYVIKRIIARSERHHLEHPGHRHGASGMED